IHNLHHRWTGWRDRDPTTEDTVNPNFGPVMRVVVNLSWMLYFPLFSIAYRLGNYWSLKKLKKYLPAKKLPAIYLNQAIFLALYLMLFIFFGGWIVKHILL